MFNISVKTIKDNKYIVLAVIVLALVGVAFWQKWGPFKNVDFFEEDYEDQIEEEDFFDDEDEEPFEEDVEPVSDDIEGYEDVAEQKKVPATKDATLQKGLEARKQLKPEQLLPKDNEAGAWSKVNPKVNPKP